MSCYTSESVENDFIALLVTHKLQQTSMKERCASYYVSLDALADDQ